MKGSCGKMYGKSFITGMGLGLAVGMTVSVVMMPKKKVKGPACKMMKVVGDIVDSVSDMFG